MTLRLGFLIALVALAGCEAQPPDKQAIMNITKAIYKRYPGKFKERSADIREILATDMDISRALTEEQAKTLDAVRNCPNWVICDGYVMPAAPPSNCNMGC